MSDKTRMRKYHSAVWDEPIVLEMGAPGRRAYVPPGTEDEVIQAVGRAGDLIPEGLRRQSPPVLPEMTEFEVQRHYLHLSQETLGMMGVSLFGTCTMKYNPRLNELLATRPEIAEVHPLQSQDTLQGVLEIIYGMDLVLRALSGMDQFVFQPGGGADAAYAFACVARAYFEAKGELARRNQVITTIQSHPSSAATAAAAGFEVVTLMIGEDGYPSVEALKAAVSDKTAALMIVNPDDMGVYNPHIKQWTDIVHAAGGLCFHDQANFNGVMGQVRASELGFDAWMVMLHKTFGAPKGGGGPAVGALGCREHLVPFMPGPLVGREEDGQYSFRIEGPHSVGRVKEFFGNVPQILRAYSWSLAMGRDGMRTASEISVLANNYMEKRLLAIRGVTKSHPHLAGFRMEMTRYSLEKLHADTGVSVADVANRMTDFGIDAPWTSHEPQLVPEPLTPEVGELWSLEDINHWINALAEISNEAYHSPEVVLTAPHNHAIGQPNYERLADPEFRSTTWRAHMRKSREREETGLADRVRELAL